MLSLIPIMRKPVIAGNWKMYKTLGDAVDTAVALKPLVANSNHCDIVIAPVFTALKTVADRLEGSNLQVAGQDCSTEVEEGAHTGEVAAFMLRDVGARYVIVGHSERRQYYSETDTMVRRKVEAAVSSGLIAIMCVGESLEQRDQGIAEPVVSGQLTGGLSGLTATDLESIIIAYEPVWAVGTGRTATPEQAQEMHAFIRRVFAEGHSAEAAQAVRILYGGSVKPENIAGLMAQPDIDGALVGGASLKAETFAQIVNYK
ncbi:MAG TPA: triose-phosphate isomerase [Pyrinomonadaceae bacterium]|nr:triose-phosphate isomerase [Pyrinomonadaceae bacterium]